MKKSNPAPAKSATAAIPSKQISWNLIYILVALLAFALYANTLGHDYTVDDGTVIGSNKFTKEGVSAIGKIFSSPYRAGFWERKEGLYRPLSVAIFAVEWQLAPNKPWPGHLLNVLLYAFTAFVVLKVLRQLFGDSKPLVPLLATVLFVVHPIHTEVVANIKSLDEILSLLFSLGALHFLLLYANKEKTSHMVFALACYLPALFSKENSLTWIGVFPLALWFCGGKDLKKTILLTLPFLAEALFFMIVRFKVLNTVSGNYELMLINNSLVGATTLADRYATAFFIMGKYLSLLIAPVTLVFDYSYNTIPVKSFGDPLALLSLASLIALLYVAVKGLPRRNMISFGILIYFGTLILVSNLFFLIEATLAERFLYTPSLGFCIAIMAFLARYIPENKKAVNTQTFPVDHTTLKSKIAQPFALVALLFCGRTIARNADWKTNILLLSKDVQSSPNSARIRYAYGSAILIEEALKENDGPKKNALLDEAINQLQKGVTLIPNYAEAWYHLGIAYKERGDGKNAVAALEQSNSYHTFNDAAHFMAAGMAYGMIGNYEKSIPYLEKSIALDSTDADNWNNYGLYLCEAGKLDASFKALNKALSIRPDFYKAYYNRGNTWAKANNFRQAMLDYAKSAELKPDYSDAYNNYGNCYGAMMKPDSALPWFEKAVNADPTNVKAVVNLGITYKLLGDSVNAKKYLDQARAQGAGI